MQGLQFVGFVMTVENQQQVQPIQTSTIAVMQNLRRRRTQVDDILNLQYKIQHKGILAEMQEEGSHCSPQKKKVGIYLVYPRNKVGEGGFSVVCKAKNSLSKQMLAVKIIDKNQINTNKKRITSLEQEVEILKKLESPNIVRFVEFHQSPHFYYIFQQLADTSLRTLLSNQPNRCFSEPQTIQYLSQIINGFVQLCKFGIMHRDIKPENILVKNNVLKISDFGLSRYVGSGFSAKSTSGTPSYMSPQVCLNQTGSTTYTQKCDIWSIGLVAYQMLTGCLPWQNTKNINIKARVETMIKTHQKHKNQIPLPPDLIISQKMQHFIIGCLKFEQHDRLSWNDVFNHDIFEGKFKDKTSNMQNYLITELRQKIHGENINIQKFITYFPNTLTHEQFFCFIRAINKNAYEYQCNNLFKQIALGQKKIKAVSIINFFQLHNIKVDGIQAKVLPNQELKAQKEYKLQRKLIRSVQQNKINMFQFYLKFYVQEKNPRLGKEEFEHLIKIIYPQVEQQQLDEYYNYFNPDKAQRFFFVNFYEDLCYVVQVPCISELPVIESILSMKNKLK